MATADHHESAPLDPTQHDPTLDAPARRLIWDERFDLSLYKAGRGTDPPQNGPSAKRPEVLTVLFSGAIQEIESQPAFKLRMMSDKPEKTPSGKPAGPTTILVVDDSKDIRNLFRTVLQHHGYEVLVAADGESALQVYHQHRGVIHLVVIDIVMPGMSGLKLAAKFLTLRPDIKVLFVSAFVQETALQGKLRPADRFLAKPIPPERLITKVQEMLAA